MEEDNNNKMEINEPLNLEEAATTLIEMGIKELQQPQHNTKRHFRARNKPAAQQTRPGVIPNIPTDAADNVKLQEALQLLANKIKEVDELKEKLKSMEQNMLLNSNKPKFSRSEYLHPLNFIEDLLSYLESNPSLSPVETAMDCLYDDAKTWATIFKPRWKNIDDFKRDFLQQYWGNAEQSMLRQEIITDFWDRDTETMSRHFMCLVAQAKWLTHQIPEEVLVNDIMHHYPKYVQIPWVVSKNSTIVEALEFLTKLEDVHKQFEGKQKMRMRLLKQNQKLPHKKPKNQSTAAPGNVEAGREQCSYLLNTATTEANAAHVAGGNEKQNEDNMAMRQRLMEQCKYILDRKWMKPTEATTSVGSENLGAVINI